MIPTFYSLVILYTERSMQARDRKLFRPQTGTAKGRSLNMGV